MSSRKLGLLLLIPAAGLLLSSHKRQRMWSASGEAPGEFGPCGPGRHRFGRAAFGSGAFGPGRFGPRGFGFGAHGRFAGPGHGHGEHGGGWHLPPVVESMLDQWHSATHGEATDLA